MFKILFAFRRIIAGYEGKELKRLTEAELNSLAVKSVESEELKNRRMKVGNANKKYM